MQFSAATGRTCNSCGRRVWMTKESRQKAWSDLSGKCEAGPDPLQHPPWQIETHQYVELQGKNTRALESRRVRTLQHRWPGPRTRGIAAKMML